MDSINSVDQLDLSTAKHIVKWLMPRLEGAQLTDTQAKTSARNFLRHHKLTPYEALERIRKQNSGMPGFNKF
jgi:hypothetical protein